MPKIRIIKMPPGEAPEWVRQAWIGLELETSGLQPDTAETRAETKGVLSGQIEVSNAGGYVVSPVEAFKVLRTTAPDAFDWWWKHYDKKWDFSRFTRAMEEVFSVTYVGELLFHKDVCELIP